MQSLRGPSWALRAKAVLDRTRLLLADKAEHLQLLMQPAAKYLGAKLGVEQWAVRRGGRKGGGRHGMEGGERGGAVERL